MRMDKQDIEIVETTAEDTIPGGAYCPEVEVMVCSDCVFITQPKTSADVEDTGEDLIMVTRRQAFEIWSALEKGLFGGP